MLPVGSFEGESQTTFPGNTGPADAILPEQIIKRNKDIKNDGISKKRLSIK
jgi:hypothetical protein